MLSNSWIERDSGVLQSLKGTPVVFGWPACLVLPGLVQDQSSEWA